MNEIIINDKPLPVKEYKGNRVVTFKEIGAVHGRKDGTARKRFNDNKKRFIEGVDYFVRKTDEAAKEYGITAQKIGRISNEHNMKTSEYGAWYRSKSEYSDREVDTFRYNDKAIEQFRTILLFREVMG